MSKTTKKFASAILDASKEKTSSYDTSAVVKRVEGNTAWVHIPGGVEETPVKMTVAAKEGDNVQVRVSGGRAWLQGNATAPPTDDTTAIYAVSTATDAQKEASIAKSAADNAVADAARAADAANRAETSATEAKVSAENASEYASRSLASLSTVQSVSETLTWITQHGTMTLTSDTELDPTHVYFVADANGDYVVNNVHYSLVTEPNADDLSTYYELSIDESLNNYVGTHLALTGEGLWLLPASSGTNKVLIATGAGTTYTTAGTYIINSTGGVEASFRSNGATIGQVLNGYSRTEIGTNGMQIIQRASGSDTLIAHLGYDVGAGQTTGTEATAPYYSLGTRLSSADAYSASSTYAIGDVCKYNNKLYVCVVAISTAESWTANHWAEAKIGNWSTAEGINNVAMYMCHAEGSSNKILGNYNHGEGVQNVITTRAAAGSIGASHVEGYRNIVDAGYAHAEGSENIVTKNAGHVEGRGCAVEGFGGHAQNEYTVVGSNFQTAMGKYNIKDSNNVYALIIGNGEGPEILRSNALTVDWDGNVDIASGAKYKINGTALSASDVSALPLSGGTMTGQIKTSFNSSVAMGSYGASASTVPNLIDEVRLSSGCAGSASISTAYTKDGVTIATGWYNFLWMPHRSGGVNGAESGDNCKYGQLLLFGMNNTNGRFIVRVSSSSIQEVSKLLTSVEVSKVKTTFTPTSGSSYSTYGGCYYETYGNMVHVHVGVSGLTANTGTTIFTLPSAVRPSSTIFGHGTGGTATNIGYLEVRTTGVVYVYSNGSTYVGADVTYMV